MFKFDITIIIPVFNSENYIAYLLDSIFAQENINFEVVIINDGSTDNSLEIINEYKKRDNRIRIFNQENRGVSIARNHGIKYAGGEWVLFIDSDDWLKPQILKKWLDQAIAQKLDVLIGNGVSFTEDPFSQGNKRITRRQPYGRVLTGKEWIEYCVECREWPHFVWLQLIKKELIINNQLSFRENILHEDILWTINLSLIANRIGFCEELLYCYRHNLESITRSGEIKKLYHRADSYITVVDSIIDISKGIKGDKSLRRSLIRHAIREVGSFFILYRKRIQDPSLKKLLAKRFVEKIALRDLLPGVHNYHELWFIIRCNLILVLRRFMD
ncbi:glycosyltransferase [Photorhabdus noenieputensis]|uniref:glycosyltransferase n=1 Tax=Photorhabdus noenieputensis TaxID=1208607 RepID=UPI001BD25BEC|nr:glycosyltransferase [Photorhabdus noenieputensis]MBS9436617.1 glycosyltransferase [Photorhabdus noenieputensis]MCK3668424.1 glycosyltransferase [Photorhabdus noenieputensis]